MQEKTFLKLFIFYSIFGGMGVLTDFLVYSSFIVLKINYQLANLFGYFCGGVVSYILNLKYNFKVDDQILKRFYKYLIIAIIGYFISVLILYMMVDIYMIDVIISKIITLIFVVLIQFNLNKKYTFKKE